MCDRYCAPNCQNSKCIAAKNLDDVYVCTCPEGRPCGEDCGARKLCAFRVGDVCQRRDNMFPHTLYTIIAISSDEMVAQCGQRYITFNLQGYSAIGFTIDPPKRTKTEVRYVGMKYFHGRWYVVFREEYRWLQMSDMQRSTVVDVKRIKFEVPC